MTSSNHDQQQDAAATGRLLTVASTAAERSAGTIITAERIDRNRIETTSRIRSSTSVKEGISWECSNLLHFEDINNEVQDDDSSDDSGDESSDDDCNGSDNDKGQKTTKKHSKSRKTSVNDDLMTAFSSGLTIRRNSLVESFHQNVVKKHISAGSLSRVSSSCDATASGNNSSSLRSYLSFSSGPDAAAGYASAHRTSTGSTGAGLNANFDFEVTVSSQGRNANASSAGRALLDRRNSTH